MTEKEKMLSQKLYDAGDKELVEDRLRAKDLCYKFNNKKPQDLESKKEIIKDLGIKTQGKYEILAPFWCDYGYNIEIGQNFFANHNTIIIDYAKVKFGDNVFIGPNCGFYTAGHPLEVVKRNVGLEYAYPITIGDNVWIGGGVHIMPGVTIGDNSVIGGGSVVVNDIPANTLAAGNPCKLIRKLESKDL